VKEVIIVRFDALQSPLAAMTVKGTMFCILDYIYAELSVASGQTANVGRSRTAAA
jgi:hypothetical protein